MKKPTIFSIMLFASLLIKGQSFQEVCGGATTNGTIVDFQEYGDTIYGTGFFSTICGDNSGYMAKWEDNQWMPTNINIEDPGHSLEVINEELYIAKYEENADSNWVYKYNNSSLETLGDGVFLTTASGFSQVPNIYDVVEYDDQIIVCGEFDRVGQQSISGIMLWNGTQWESLGSGVSGNIDNSPPVMFPHQLLVINLELYVVGNFKYAGDQEANGIAKWNGEEWIILGEGFNGTVYSIVEYDGEIIVGGSFTESGSTPIDRIAKWNGIQWEPLAFGFTAPTSNDFIFVHTLKVFDDLLYISGGLKELTYSNNSTAVCNGIVSYNGDVINTFNNGIEDFDIEAIIKSQDQELLIGGGVFGNGYAGILDLNTNVAELTTNKVQVIPNPFMDFINIQTEHRFHKYVLYDKTGRVIRFGDHKNQLNFELNPGVYILHLEADDFISVHKLIKN